MREKNSAEFRFYAELNDFLPPDRQYRHFPYWFDGNPAVKDAVEALGVPHPEIDLILANGVSVDFSYQLHAGDNVTVYPVFESLDISPVVRLRPAPLRVSRFILDVHLGKLARLLRWLGFDTLYRNDYDDAEIVRIAIAEQRIILTRDLGILKYSGVTRGYWLRSTDPEAQIREILARFDLFSQLNPFSRCSVCNGLVAPVSKDAIRSLLLPNTARYFDGFFQCQHCQRVYWKGSHYEKLREKMKTYLNLENTASDFNDTEALNS